MIETLLCCAGLCIVAIGLGAAIYAAQASFREGDYGFGVIFSTGAIAIAFVLAAMSLILWQVWHRLGA